MRERDSRIKVSLRAFVYGNQEAALNYFYRSSCQEHCPGLRLRNLSLSDSGFRLSSRATTVVARLVLRPATVPVNRRTRRTVADEIACKILRSRFLSYIPTRFLKAEAQIRITDRIPRFRSLYSSYVIRRMISQYDYSSSSFCYEGDRKNSHSLG